MKNLTQPTEDFDHLSPAELSSLVDMVTAQIEYCQSEIVRLRPILHRLQERIPNQPIREFIESITDFIKSLED